MHHWHWHSLQAVTVCHTNRDY